MNAERLRRGKTILNVLWVVLAISLFLDGGGFVGLLQTLFWVLLVAHVLEFLFFYRAFAESGEPLGHHFVQTVLYGMVHYQLFQAGRGQSGVGPD